MNTAPAHPLDHRFERRLVGRVAVLAAAVLATVLVPYLLIRDWSREALAAEAWVQHSILVSDTTAQMMFHLRDMASSAYGRLAGMQTPVLRERYRASGSRVEALIRELERQTQDNPEQLVRVGQMKAMFEQRKPYLDATFESTDPATDTELLRQLEELVVKVNITDVALGLARAEDRLLAERAELATRLRADVDWLQTVSLFAQILLLGAIALVAERDARARRRAEHESTEADLRNRAIFHAVHEPIALLDHDLNILTRNTAFDEMYGSADAASTRQPLGSSGAGAWDDSALQQRLSDVVARNREIWDYEHRQRTLDGVARHVMINARQILLPDETERAVLLTVSDVTALKLAESRVLELNRRLEGKIQQVSEANRELEAFSYSVSHDLRAPLRHISGFADKLRRHLSPADLADEKTSHYLEVISGSAARMATLIDDLLLYSRLGRSAMQWQNVDLDRVVAEIREMLSSQARGRIQWRVQPLPRVPGDETMLRQVWQNLLSNAIKYSGHRDQAVIEVEHRLSDGLHEFSVRDNGVGFDMNYAGKLFGVFQRLHKATEFPGSGIGLANVRRIVTRHGGRVWAEAEPDRGATFHFTLPQRQDAPEAADETTENTR